MALRHAPLLLALAVTASWAATPATPPHSTVPSAATANHKAVHYCKLSHPREPGCVDPIFAAASAILAEDAKCLRQTEPTAECYQDLRTSLEADRITIRRLQGQVSQLQIRRQPYPVRRSHQEMEEANRVFDSEFGDLRKTPGAFALASDLVVERMKDPRYASVPLDTIVRDVASRVARVASAGNEQLAAEAEAAKREAAQTREDANRAINDAYDKAERVVDAAQAIVQGSASDADMAAAMAAINSFPRPATAPGAPALAPYAHCTSRTVGQGSYARVETDCN